MSYPCHYTNLCPHKPHKHAHTHTHIHTHTYTHTHTHTHVAFYGLRGLSIRVILFIQTVCAIAPPHRHFPHGIQAGSGNPTAQKTYIKHFSYIKLQTYLSPSFIAKTLEQVVFNQVSLFLSQNNKLDANQSGFRSGHSTETALLSVTEALRIAKADSKLSVLILLDLSAAFDTVNHQILQSTLSSLCITGIHLRWFESYLNGRSFWVAWEGRYPKHINWSLGFLRGRFLDPSSSPHTLYHWVPSYKHMVSFSSTIAMLMTHSSISHFDQMIQR